MSRYSDGNGQLADEAPTPFALEALRSYEQTNEAAPQEVRSPFEDIPHELGGESSAGEAFEYQPTSELWSQNSEQPAVSEELTAEAEVRREQPRGRKPWARPTTSPFSRLRARRERSNELEASEVFEGETSSSPLMAPIEAALSAGSWMAAVGLALLGGLRDRTKLTNMIFYARHKELKGRKIRKSEKKLAAEWMAIYNKLVVPQLGPVSGASVSPSAVPVQDKPIDKLAQDIVQSEWAILTSWSGALTQFQVVMTSASDAEGVPDFVGKILEHLGKMVIDKIADQSKVVSFAKDMLDTLGAEYERARQARDSATLRDFIVKMVGTITDLQTNLMRSKADFEQLVEQTYNAASGSDRDEYRKALEDHLNALDANWKTLPQIFQLIAEQWIRSTKTNAEGLDRPAFVIIRLEPDWTVRDAEILAPGGQKLAEQLLKNGPDAGIKPAEWAVPRRILFFKNKGDDWPHGWIKLDSNGEWTQDGNLAENSEDGAPIHRRMQREPLPPVKKVTGSK